MGRAKKPRNIDTETEDTGGTDAIDVLSSDRLGDYVPDKLRTALERVADRVVKIVVRHLPADAPTLSSWRHCPGVFRQPAGEASVDALGRRVLEIAIAHWRKAEDKPRRYQAQISFESADGNVLSTGVAFELEGNLEGTIYAIDTDDQAAATEQGMWREQVVRLESQNKMLADALSQERSEHREDMKMLFSETRQLVHELASVAGGVAGMVGGVTTGLSAAAQAHAEVAGEQYKIRKLELETDERRAAAEQAAQVRQMGLDTLKTYGPLILGHVLKLSPAEIAAVTAAASQDGASNTGALLSPEAKAWSPPKKPIVDPDKPDEELQIDGVLSRWFLTLTDDQERAARVVVGADLYDRIRDSTGKGPEAATAAVQALNGEVRKLSGAQRADLVRSITRAIGSDNAFWFLAIMKGAGGLDEQGDNVDRDGDDVRA